MVLKILIKHSLYVSLPGNGIYLLLFQQRVDRKVKGSVNCQFQSRKSRSESAPLLNWLYYSDWNDWDLKHKNFFECLFKRQGNEIGKTHFVVWCLIGVFLEVNLMKGLQACRLYSHFTCIYKNCKALLPQPKSYCLN